MLIGLPIARSEANQIDKSIEELRKIVSDAGSYLSESDLFERSWQKSFWGSELPETPGSETTI
jgi:hypothetical protein